MTDPLIPPHRTGVRVEDERGPKVIANGAYEPEGLSQLPVLRREVLILRQHGSGCRHRDLRFPSAPREVVVFDPYVCGCGAFGSLDFAKEHGPAEHEGLRRDSRFGKRSYRDGVHERSRCALPLNGCGERQRERSAPVARTTLQPSANVQGSLAVEIGDFAQSVPRRDGGQNFDSLQRVAFPGTVGTDQDYERFQEFDPRVPEALEVDEMMHGSGLDGGDRRRRAALDD